MIVSLNVIEFMLNAMQIVRAAPIAQKAAMIVNIRFASVQEPLTTHHLLVQIKSMIDNAEKVLILNTYKPENVPVLTDFNGNVNSKLKFAMPEGTEVYRSCSTMLHGQHYIFGGRTETRQISIVDPERCVLRRAGNLTFDFQYGGCQTFMMPDERALLCFGYSSQTCAR